MPRSSFNHPAESLLLEYAQPKPGDHICILEGGDGWLAKELAGCFPYSSVFSYDRDIRNYHAAQKLLRKHSNAKPKAQTLPDKKGWDIVLLIIPKERSFSKLCILKSFQILKEGGQLLIAGPTRSGAKAVIKDAERLFGNVIVLGYRSHQRIAKSVRESQRQPALPDTFQKAGIAPATHQNVVVDTPAGLLGFQSCPGIFSWEKLDAGTSMLIKHLPDNIGTAAWDVGCGYGVIGLVIASMGVDLVWLSDTNLLAIKYTQINAEMNSFTQNVQIFPADGFNLPEKKNPLQKFDLIISNPAFHQGRQVDKSMAHHLITKAPNFLNSKGRLLMVANRFLNYDKLMKENYRKVTRIAEDGRFHILEGRI